MNGTITNEGKVTVSLTIRQWIGVIAAVLVVGFYIYRIEMGRREAASFSGEQRASDLARDKTLRSHGLRLARVERRLGIKRFRVRQAEEAEQEESWFWRN